MDIYFSYLRQRRLRNGDPSLSAYEKILAAIGSSPRWFEDEINLSKSIDRKETIESKC